MYAVRKLSRFWGSFAGRLGTALATRLHKAVPRYIRVLNQGMQQGI